MPPGAQATPEYAVPARRQDLSGLPPAWIGVGDLDLFLEEDTTYAERLRDADVDVELALFGGGPHGFLSLDPKAPISIDYFDRAGAFLQRRLHD